MSHALGQDRYSLTMSSVISITSQIYLSVHRKRPGLFPVDNDFTRPLPI